MSTSCNEDVKQTTGMPGRTEMKGTTPSPLPMKLRKCDLTAVRLARCALSVLNAQCSMLKAQCSKLNALRETRLAHGRLCWNSGLAEPPLSNHIQCGVFDPKSRKKVTTVAAHEADLREEWLQCSPGRANSRLSSPSFSCWSLDSLHIQGPRPLSSLPPMPLSFLASFSSLLGLFNYTPARTPPCPPPDSSDNGRPVVIAFSFFVSKII